MRKILQLLAISGLCLAGFMWPSAAQQIPPTQCVTNAVAGGTGDAITVPLLPCGLATNLLILTESAINTTTTPTLQMIGFPAQPIINADGNSVPVGIFAGNGAVALLSATGSKWLLLAVGPALSGPSPFPNGIINPNGTGGIVMDGGELGSGNGVFYGPAQLELSNSLANPGPAGLSLVNTIPGLIGTTGSPEYAIRCETVYSSVGTQTCAMGNYVTETGQHSGVVNTSVSGNNPTSNYQEVIGYVGGNLVASTPMILSSNNSAIVLSGPASSLYLFDAIPPPNWWHNLGFEHVDGGYTSGSPLPFTGTVTSGSNVITSVTPDPTATATFVQVGQYIQGTDLPLTAIVTGTTSNSITFDCPGPTACNAVGTPGAGAINIYPGAMSSPNFSMEITGAGNSRGNGYIRSSKIQGGPGADFGYDGVSGGFFECDIVNGGDAFAPCTFQGSTIALKATSMVTNAPFTVGTLTPGTGQKGDIILAKETDAGAAPGAGLVTMKAVAGTNSGSCKLIAYAGTSTSPVTILDNIGSGC